jgi:hypothetical protein
VDIVFANESEARAYTGKGPEEALQEISSKCSIVVIKRLQSAHQNRFPPYREKLFGEFGPHAQALATGNNQSILNHL